MLFKNQAFTNFIPVKFHRFIRFGTVGFLGFLINAGILESLKFTHLLLPVASIFRNFKGVPVLETLSLEVSWASGISIECSIISNFIFNNIWTFSGYRAKKFRKIIGNFLKFNFTSVGAVIIQFFSLGFSQLLFGESRTIRILTLIFTILFLIMPYNWIIYNKIIWKTKEQPTQTKQQGEHKNAF